MRTFAQMIANIRKSDDALREAVAETAVYITLQYHRNNRKADGAGQAFMPQFVAALPAWLQKEAGKFQLQTGKRIHDMTEQMAEMRIDAMIGVAFASQEEKRRIARENRSARKEAKGEPETVTETQKIELAEDAGALFAAGEMIQLTPEETAALVAHLNQMRAPAESTVLRIAA